LGDWKLEAVEIPPLKGYDETVLAYRLEVPAG
jgi:hypothetical protein